LERKAAFAGSLLLVFSVVFLIAELSSATAQTGAIRIGADGQVSPASAPVSTSDGVTFTLTANILDQTIIIEKNNITLEGNGHTLEGTNVVGGKGVDLSERVGVTVKNLQLATCYYGVFLSNSVGNKLVGCVISNCPYGIRAESSSTENAVSGCNVTHNTYGVWFSNSDRNSFTGNNMQNNLYVGLYLNASQASVITSNSFANNGNGVYLTQSDSNIYLNNFLNNSADAYSEASRSNWSSTERVSYSFGGVARESFVGNYWSSSINADGNGDGVADAPRVVAGGEADAYPLVQPIQAYLEAGTSPAPSGTQQASTATPTGSQQPLAGVSLSYLPVSPRLNETVTFAASVTGLGGSVLNYTWNFGDGSIQTSTSPTIDHSYAGSGGYTVSVTATMSTGEKPVATRVVSVSAEEAKSVPSNFVVLAVSAVTVTTALTAVGGTVGGLILPKLKLPDFLKGFAKSYGAKLFEQADLQELKQLKKAPFLTNSEMLEIGVSILLMTAVFSFVEANGYPRILDAVVLAAVVPKVFISSVVVKLASVVFDTACSRVSHVYRRFSLWVTGVATFLFSGFVFMFPFASPGIIRYKGPAKTKKSQCLIVLSKNLLLLTFLIPFGLLTMSGNAILGDAGTFAALTTVCYSLVPLPPLSGKAVFSYNKTLSLVVLVLLGVLLFAFSLQLLPSTAYIIAGAVSGAVAAIAMVWLRKHD
jgi:parallel beta-helix repeat protein